jgi:hypothetical protein
MSVLKDVLDGVRQVLVLTDEVRRNATAVSALAIEVRGMDARLIAVETKVEVMLGLATAKAAQPREALPSAPNKARGRKRD